MTKNKIQTLILFFILVSWSSVFASVSSQVNNQEFIEKSALSGKNQWNRFANHNLNDSGADLSARRVLQRQTTIQGNVTDAITGDPLPGVNIFVPGTTIGTSTDNNGQYSLNVPENADTLAFSYIGYITQRVAINNRTQIDIQLEPTTITSSQIVVVGYGTQRKSDLTGSISTVKGTDVSRIPTTNVDNALQGQIAGVQITPNSGQPGTPATIRIRGVGTLNNASPIYVVDGMITNDISYLNPEDVQSVEVLKDASATAIYGSRGANGVIIITTKKGTIDQKVQINFNGYYGWQDIQHKISLTNASQYATLVNELNANEGRPPTFQDPNSLGQGTNWQNEVYKTAPTQNYNMSVSGGTDKLTYNISGNYVGQKGIISGSQYKRMSLRVNNDYFFTKNLKVGHNIAYMHDYQQEAAPGVVGQAYQADPTKNPFTSNGDYNNITQNAPVGNPLATIFYNSNRHYANRIVGNIYAQLSVLNNFQVKTSFGLDSWQKDWKTFNPQYFVSPIQQAQHSQLNVNNENSRNWLWENTITYKNSFGFNNVQLLAGITAQGFKDEILSGSRQDIAGNGSNPALWYLNAGNQQSQSNSNAAYNWNMLSYLFRANYNYQNRYLLTATYRIDGSSRFGSANRYGHFPSVAVGWRLSNEPFLRNSEYISNLKLRASWGKIGNDKITAYPGIPTVSSNLNAVFGPNETINYGATIISLANPDIRWEQTRQTDIGLEAGFLKDRLSLEVDYYHKYTDGILVQAPIPAYVGASNIPYVNAASVINRGFDFNVSWDQTVSGFHYTVGVVASTVHNEVDKLGQGQDAIFAGGTGEGGKLATRTVVGGPIGAFYGYKVVGVFQSQDEITQYNDQAVAAAKQNGTYDPNKTYTYEPGAVPGDLIFQDTDGDGTITSTDRTYIGSPIPSFIYGVHLSASYKGFDFSVTTSGQTGNKIYNAKKTARFGTPNFETSYLDRWNGQGTSNSEPRLTNGGMNYNVSTRFLEDGAYFTIRNIQLGYNLPRSLTQQVNVRGIKVYLNVENLVTFTKYSGYTPQISGSTISENGIGQTSTNVLDSGIDHGVYPIARTFSVGVNIRF